MAMARASFSRLQFYKNCPKAYNFKYNLKIEELDRPVMLDKQGNPKPHANERGSTIHEAMDDYINARRDDLIPELLDIKDEVNAARALKTANPAQVVTEQKWFFDELWNMIEVPPNQTFPEKYHLVIIIDLLIFNKDFTSCQVIDLKSGKRYRNEVKHAKQTQLYAVATAIRYPDLKNLVTELWYCDLGLIHTKPFTGQQALAFKRYWDNEMSEMADDVLFDHKAAQNTCMFCAYGPTEHSNKWVNKTGDCTDGRSK